MGAVKALKVMKVEAGDICCWRSGFGAPIDPPLWGVVTEIRRDNPHAPWAHARIADRGGLSDSIAIHGTVSWCLIVDKDDIEIVTPNDVPDDMWPKIALAHMLEGVKPDAGN